MDAPHRSRTPPPNLAEALARVEHDAGLDERRRRDFSGAIRTICAILGKAPHEVPASAAWIDAQLRTVPRAAHGRADKTVANARSRLKAALRWCSGGPAFARRGAPLSQSWRALRESLPTPRLRAGLSRLIRIASDAGVAPEQVDDEFVERVAREVEESGSGRGGVAYRRQVAACWNEASATLAGWPRATLTVPPGAVARPARLPLEAFPASFQRDVERYLAWAAESGRLARDGAPRRLAPGTVRQRREHLRLAAAALARRLGYTRRVISLAVLVEPVNFKLVVAEYLERAEGGRPGAFVLGLAVTLFGVARQWVKAPVSQLDQLGQLKRRLGGRGSGLAERSRRAIAAFGHPAALADLLALPERLFTRASADPSPGAGPLRSAQAAVAIALLLGAPMRLHQLASLRVGREFLRPAGRKGPVSIVLQAGAGSGARVLEYPVAGSPGRILDEYLERFHGRTAPNPDGWLFARPDGAPVGGAALRELIVAATRRGTGVALTPGQLRHLAAAMVLSERPGDFRLVGELLGHARVQTATHLYAGLGTPGAASFYGAVLERARAARNSEIAPHAAGASPTRS